MTSVLGEKLREAIEKKNLATTIKQWDDEDNNTKQNIKDIPVIALPTTAKKNTFAVTTNASRVTFDFVKRNSCKYTTQEIATELTKQGQKHATVGSLISQMVRNNILYRTKTGTVGALVNEYTPVKSPTTLRNIEKRNQEEQKRQATLAATTAPPRKIVVVSKKTGLEVGTGIAALGKEGPPRHDPAKWNANEVIESLSLKQGHELYLKLKRIFGGQE